jgi:hypothetical protein
MDNQGMAEWSRNKQPPNPVFLKVFEKMKETGELDGLSEDESLERVLDTTEALLESVKSK